MTMPRMVVWLVPISILGLFATSLIGIDRLAFRDVSHFYTPLYDYVDWRMSSQWLPMWNPLDHTGIPLLGETTTAVLYPPRIFVYALPISSTTAMAWYIVFHLILAALTSYRAARWSNASPLAATVAALVYPLSGVVLSLYCNPSFLCGAAWLPLLLSALIAAPDLSPSKRTLIASITLAMMVLAGDPQTALHGMLLATIIWIGRRCFAAKKHRDTRQPGFPGWVLLASPIMASILAAPQLAASVSWSQQSDRVTVERTQRWWEPPIVSSKRHESFQYSLAPWHLLELATPQAFGSLLPEHRRISGRIPGDGRMWTPTIYMGLLTILALLFRLMKCRTGGIDVWMVITLLSLWLAMGQFGLVWVIQTNTNWLSDVDSAIGGAYWFLYQFLPGYDSFRYPAKWLIPFALGAAIVTASVIDDWIASPQIDRRWICCAGWLVSFGLIAALVLRWDPSWLIDPRITDPKDLFWGPLRVTAAFSEIAISWLHSWLTWIAIALVLLLANRQRLSPAVIGYGLLVITLADVTISSSSLIHRVRLREEQNALTQMNVPRTPASKNRNARWMRTRSGSGWPDSWRSSSAPDRLLEVESSQRAAWFGRWHLADRAAVFNSMASIRSQPMSQFWSATREITQTLTPEQAESFWQSMRQWLSIQHVQHTTDQFDPWVRNDGTRLQLVAIRVRDPLRSPRLRVHWDWSHQREPASGGVLTAERLRKIWQQENSAPVIQTLGRPSAVAKPSTTPATTGIANLETVEPAASESGSRKSSAEQEQVLVDLSQPALLTRSTYQDGHWKAEFRQPNSSTWQPTEVHQVDGLIQGVVLPAGTWQLRFRYQPWWLKWTLTLAAIGWLGVCGWGYRNLARNRMPGNSTRVNQPQQASLSGASDR